MIRLISYFITLLLTMTATSSAFATTSVQDINRGHLTKLARYQAGIYLAGEGTHLRVNIDKQLGGQLTIQLSDSTGQQYFNQTVKARETTIRLNLNLTELTDGNYTLKISNGLEVVIREIKITTIQPSIAPRSIAILNRGLIPE